MQYVQGGFDFFSKPGCKPIGRDFHLRSRQGRGQFWRGVIRETLRERCRCVQRGAAQDLGVDRRQRAAARGLRLDPAPSAAAILSLWLVLLLISVRWFLRPDA